MLAMIFYSRRKYVVSKNCLIVNIYTYACVHTYINADFSVLSICLFTNFIVYLLPTFQFVQIDFDPKISANTKVHDPKCRWLPMPQQILQDFHPRPVEVK